MCSPRRNSLQPSQVPAHPCEKARRLGGELPFSALKSRFAIALPRHRAHPALLRHCVLRVPLVCSPRLIVVPERKILLWLISSFFATQGQCRLPGCSSLQGFGITSVGAGIPPLRISASGTPMPPRSGSSGGMRLVPETNSQKLSEPGLYYKTFAGTKPAPPERSLAHV